MTLRELVGRLSERPAAVEGNLEVAISSLVSDSRTAGPGALFFALRGTRADGASFISEAVERGAVGVVAREGVPVPEGAAAVRARAVDRAVSEMAAFFYGQPSRKLVLVGVTGTNGKTTTTYLLESIFRAAGREVGVIGTVSYRFAGREAPAPLTTPAAIELQCLLASMVAGGVTHALMEVSSHALALGRARDCDFDSAVFTNLSRDHLDFHSDLESYFEAKARLFTELLPASSKPDPCAVVHRDDPYGRRLLERLTTRVVTFGKTEEADVAPLEIERSLAGLGGRLRVGRDSLEISSSLVGDAHLENILAAAATAFGQKIDPGAIRDGIRRCRGVPGRMERVDADAPFAVLVDYAHTPDALERALRALRALCRGRLIVIFGCGGDRDRGKRPIMGEAAGRLADVVIVTSDNPRTEDPARIVHEIEGGVREAGLEATDESRVRRGEGDGYMIVLDRRQAIRIAIEVARPADVVLIAGKGHEPYQIVGAERRAFDDREEAQRWLGRSVTRLRLTPAS